MGQRYVRAKRRENPDGRMPLMDHLRELRNRLLKAIIVIAIGMGIALLLLQPHDPVGHSPVLLRDHQRA